ncbi:MAG: NADH oxidase, partial [Pseudomonadota bacterium]|nr:NADH oxidase [Pseudomonadota bacterium]
MTEHKSKEIRSKVTEEGFMEISIVKASMPTPKEDEVLIKIEASPINPSDLGKLISFAAILDDIEVSGSGDEMVTKIRL